MRLVRAILRCSVKVIYSNSNRGRSVGTTGCGNRERFGLCMFNGSAIPSSVSKAEREKQIQNVGVIVGELVKQEVCHLPGSHCRVCGGERRRRPG